MRRSRPRLWRLRTALLQALLPALLPALLLWAAPAQSDELYQADAVKAAFLYRFTGYVDWPPAADSSSFTIAVLDADAVADALARFLPDHPVKNLPAQVRRVHSAREAAGAQVLYVGAAYTGDLHALAEALAAQPILLVTDQDGALDEGSAVNFLLADHRVRFEVSVAAAEKAGLKIGSELLTVAARVRGLPHSDSCLPGWPELPGAAGVTCPLQVAGR